LVVNTSAVDCLERLVPDVAETSKFKVNITGRVLMNYSTSFVNSIVKSYLIKAQWNKRFRARLNAVYLFIYLFIIILSICLKCAFSVYQTSLVGCYFVLSIAFCP